MSEFSESYHLRTTRAEDAVDLLQRAGRKGFVYPPANGWVTFLAEESNFEPDELIVAAARHPLLHYVSAEDHGWSFALFDHGEVVSAYRCDWDDDFRIDDSRYSRAALERLVPSAQPALLDEWERWSPPEEPDDPFDIGEDEVEPSKLFARALGLEHYEWLSYEYMDNDFHLSPKNYPDVIEVL